MIVRSLKLCQKHVRAQNGKDPVILARFILETNEIALVCLCILQLMQYSLAAAHDFRGKQLDVYSLDTPPLGTKLPSGLAPWTSVPEIISALAPQYDATLSVLRDFQATVSVEHDTTARRTRQQTGDMEREDIRQALEETLASLAEMLCKLCVERVNWCRALAEDEQDKSGADDIWKQYLAKRGDWIKPLGISPVDISNLATFGRPDKALDIAEIYRDYKSLVELCLEPREDDINRHQRVHERLEYYLMHYGEDFAFTLYNFYLQNRTLSN